MSMIRFLAGVGCVALAATVGAKLPATQLTDEQKATAVEAQAKAAHASKVEAYQLCRSMDRVAEKYTRDMQSKGKEVKPAEMKPCSDPGPFTTAEKK
jgi:hypothetical protein